MELLIKGARVVDCENDKLADVYIKNGIIEKTGPDLAADCEIIRGEGLVLLPSFIDLHSHFRDPGLTHKEDIQSGSRAAVKGGYTAVNLMANTKPACSSMETVNYVLKRAEETGLVDVHQTVSVTENLEGISIDHLDRITRPVRLISDDGYGVTSNDVMLRAMRKAKEKGFIIISHAEDKNISEYDMRDSENVGTLRDIALARYTGAKLHMAHVSTVEAMQEVIDAKKAGYDITCEVTPHHIALNSDIKYRVNPPLREKTDISFLIEAIRLGYVDAIGTDHAPHTPIDKQNGAPGISGLESAFSVCYTKLVKENGIDMKTLSRIMSLNPARLLGMNKGKIKEGCDGDLVLVDINKKVKIDSQRFESKGKNTPFDGMEFYGEIAATIKAGKIVYKGDGYTL